jgi:hypothetical protein
MKSLICLSIPASFLLGLFLGRGTTPAAAKPEERKAVAPVPKDPVESIVPVGETAQMSQQREEIRRLKAELEALKAPAPAAAVNKDRTAQAKEIYELFLRNKNNQGTPDERLEMLRRLSELDHDMAAWFVAQYRRSQASDEKELAFILTVLSGGPDASRFVVEMAADPAYDAKNRRQLLRTLAGLDDMPARVTAEPSLTKMGLEWVRSAQGDERAAGAGILGLGGTSDGPVILRTLADTDASDQVRAAAILSIGKIGDGDALIYLKGLDQRGDLSDYLKRYVKSAVGILERRLAK